MVCRSCTRPTWPLKYVELAVSTDGVHSTRYASDRVLLTLLSAVGNIPVTSLGISFNLQRKWVLCQSVYDQTPAYDCFQNVSYLKQICTAGNYRNATDNTCYPCPVGQYQPQDLQDQCLSCDNSYSTSGTGTVNATGCIFFCPDGYELKTPGTTTCTLCPRGTYRSNTDLLRFKTCQDCADNTRSTDNFGSKLPSDCKITSHLVLPEAFTEVVVGALLLIALAVCCYCARRYIVKRKRRREERDQTAYSLQAHEPRSDKPGQARSHSARGVTPRHTRQQQTSRERSQRHHHKRRHMSPPSQPHPDDRDWRSVAPTPCRRPATRGSANQSEPSVVSHDYSVFTSTPGNDEHVYEHIYETIPL